MNTEEKIKERLKEIIGDDMHITVDSCLELFTSEIRAEKIKLLERLLKNHLTTSIVFENGYPVRGVPQVEILNEIAFLKLERLSEEGKKQ